MSATPSPNQPAKKPWYKKWWVWVIAVLLIAIALPTKPKDEPAQDTTPPPAAAAEETQPDPEPAPEPEAEEEPEQTITIDVLGLGPDGMILTTYPVPDNLTKSWIRNALKDGCHTALTEVKTTIPDWETYGLIQCTGNLDGGELQVGSANYSGPQLQDIDLDEINSDLLWQPLRVTPDHEGGGMTRTPPANTNGHRRRQLTARLKATRTHCALCGQPLNPNAHHLDPRATVIDEDIPRSKGGNPLDPNNTNTLHRHCNTWKNTMTLAEAKTLLQLGHPLNVIPTKQSKQQLLAKPIGTWEPNANAY